MAVKVINKNQDERIAQFGTLKVGDWFMAPGGHNLGIKDTSASARILPLFVRSTFSENVLVAPVDVEIHWVYQLVEDQEDGI